MGGIVTTLFQRPDDPQFNLTTLLLPGNARPDGAQNNTFLDSSTNNFTITRNGNTTQGTFSPFSQTGWGNYFGGSDGLRTTASSLSNSQFTCEAWIYFTGTAANQCVWDLAGGSAGYGSFISVNGGSSVFSANFYSNNTGTSIGSITYSYSGLFNTWVHLATSFDGSTYRLFVNGALAGTISSATATIATSEINIGQRSGSQSSGYQWVGYISNFRYVTGAALYTAAFTPSTTPLGIAGSGTTRVLTCQSNRFVDNSSSPYTFTISGTPSVQAFSPFAPTAAYTTTAVGGSGYFDGSGDYLTTTYSNIALGSNDFTIEFWAYTTADSTYSGNLNTTKYGSSGGWILGFKNGNIAFTVYNSSGSSVINFNVSATPYYRQWVHCAVVRSGTSFAMYLNGVSVATATLSGSIDLGTYGPDLEFACSYNGGGGSSYLTGYMGSTRIISGQALTSGNFTPPTAPVTTSSVGWTGANAASSITGTVKLLTNFTNGGIFDATAKNDLETVGNASISTTQSKFGGSSMYFDGTGDYLTIPSTQNLNLGTSNFTIECWYYPVSIPANGSVLGSGGSFAAGACYFGGGSSSGNLGLRFVAYDIGGTYYIASAGALTLNTWQHIALVRSGNTFTTYVNGTSLGTGTFSGNVNFNNAGFTYVGANGWDGASSQVNGYIDDFRVTKGYARYTANFTPTTVAFQLQ